MKTVQIEQAGVSVPALPGDTILKAARNAGIEYPFSCQSGRCGACKSRILVGEVEHLAPYSKFTLTDEEKANGVVLACRAVPKSDVRVAWLRDSMERPMLALFESEVRGVSRLTHDIVRIQIALPEGLNFQFLAGQFAMLRFDGFEARSYSMANVPGERTLEFFVRKMAGGSVSTFVNERLIPGTKVSVEGPFGESFLRKSHTGPILAVAGGSGMAPIYSIVRTALASGLKQRIHLYFGVREERDLFLIDELERLRSKHQNLSTQPVVERCIASSGIKVGGRVGNAVLNDWPEFKGLWQAYIAGPPPMVESLIPELAKRGVAESNIFADAFYSAVPK